MNNNFNPYSIPEGFFESVCDRAVSKGRFHRRAVLSWSAALVLAALLLVIPVCVRSIDRKAYEKEIVENNLAQMYEYDVFLQVNF